MGGGGCGWVEGGKKKTRECNLSRAKLTRIRNTRARTHAHTHTGAHVGRTQYVRRQTKGYHVASRPSSSPSRRGSMAQLSGPGGVSGAREFGRREKNRRRRRYSHIVITLYYGGETGYEGL